MSDDAHQTAAVIAVGSTRRRRLLNRREAVTQSIEFLCADGTTVLYEATIGFDQLGRPRGIFLFGAKDGSDMQAADGARDAGRPISAIGGALDLLTRLEAEVA